jgi:hypothetical protein
MLRSRFVVTLPALLLSGCATAGNWTRTGTDAAAAITSYGGDAAVFIEVTSEKGGFTTRCPRVKRAKTG